MNNRLDEYEHLWREGVGRYLLVKTVPESEGIEDCVIFDKVDRVGEIIEDPAISAEVKRRMVDAGVQVVTDVNNI